MTLQSEPIVKIILHIKCLNLKKQKLWLSLPCADIARHLLDGLSFLLQLLRHVLQVLFVVPVCIIQKLVAGHKEHVH